jgi:hypothetical protein
MGGGRKRVSSRFQMEQAKFLPGKLAITVPMEAGIARALVLPSALEFWHVSCPFSFISIGSL